MYDINDIKDSLTALGVKNGSILFARAALKTIGEVELNNGQKFNLIDLLLEMIGSDGTLVSLAYTNAYFIKPDISDVFTLDKPSYAGAFPNIMLKHPNARRSKHPVNSVVAIGKYADYITENHTVSSKPYDPIKKLVELDAVMILIGCVESSPGFTTTHLVEQELGILNKILFTKYFKVYYNFDGENKLYTRDLQGACSSGFYKMYAKYINGCCLNTGYVGNAYSISISAKKAYDVDLNTLSENSLFALCDNKKCWMCNGRRIDNWKKFPVFYLGIIPRFFRKILSKIRK